MKKNFAKNLQSILKLAKEEAIRLGHSYVGSEHLLIGLLKIKTGTSKKIFELYDVDVVSITKMIEDLISTGKSSLNAINALRDESFNVSGMLSIFSYNFDFANKRFQNENIPINSLADFNTLVEMVLSEGSISEDEAARLMDWRNDPENWV